MYHPEFFHSKENFNFYAEVLFLVGISAEQEGQGVARAMARHVQRELSRPTGHGKARPAGAFKAHGASRNDGRDLTLSQNT